MSSLNSEDDGSLSFLGLSKDPANVHFRCEQTRQSKLVNQTFWVRDMLENVKTKHGEDRMLILISSERNTPESECRKFFTNCSDIKYVMCQIRELDAFPRKVTMRSEGGNHYFFE